ncbi:MAG TPA: twin-arginine translocase subunit TatC [Armatimonadota bacterium]|nr:twin-arginine translocase subunit TatC [Armatimonadota bacterium]
MPMHQREDFKEMELWEHLAELRSRLIRAALYVVIGMVIAWCFYPQIFNLLFAPMRPLFHQHPSWKPVFHTITEGFMVQLQVSLVSGLIIAVPLITTEIWGFVAPGLTSTERRVFYLVVPLSLLFFALGIVIGYLVMYPTVQWFGSFIPDDAQLLQSPLTYIVFMVKMVLAFGLCFQLPMVLMFLGYIGMVTSRVLVQQWRAAVVACCVLGAVATPSQDPLSMALMSVPLVLLYIVSIFLVRFVESVRDRQQKKPDATSLYAGAAAGD